MAPSIELISLLVAKIRVLREDENFSGKHMGISPLLSRISPKLRDIMDFEDAKFLDQGATEAAARIYDAICEYQIRFTKTFPVAASFPWLCRQICLRDQLLHYDLQLQRLISSRTGTTDTHNQKYHVLHSRPWVVGCRPPPLGSDKTVEKLLKLLVEDKNDRLVVLPIVGGRGSGKSTIATQIYLRARPSFECFARIRLNDSPIHCTLNHLLAQLKESRYETFNLDSQQKLQEFLLNKRYFIVLDGLGAKEEWEQIWQKIFPDHHNGSRVLVTTSDANVAYNCATDKASYHNHQPLSFSDSQALFCAAVGIDTGTTLSDAMRDRVQRMICRCAGSPFALLILAGLLSTKRKEVQDWDQVYQMVGSLHTDVSKNMMKICYDMLPGYLKPCYLYFGLFPENYSVQKQRLLRLWIAEGFVEKGSEEETVEDAADRYLNELMGRNLVYASEVGRDGRVRKCGVHEIAYSLITSKLQENNFGMLLDTQRGVDNENRIARRLSIIGDAKSVKPSSGKHISSLMTFYSSSWPKRYVLRPRLLLVLDLTDSVLDRFPGKISSCLPYLRYLSLRNTNVKHIPGSIGKLKNLVTLDVKGTFITQLPKEIACLINLQYLHVKPRSSIKQGAKLNFHITSLCKLLRLSLVDVSYRFSMVKEIKNIVNLKRLAITNLPAEDGKMLCCSLEELKQLESLSITPKINELILLEDLHSPPPLQRMYLHGQLQKVPEWIGKCQALTELKLELIEIKPDSLAFLQDLPHLRMIKLEGHTNKVDKINFKKGGFTELAFLDISDFEMLELLEIEHGAVLSLEKLLINNCPRLKKLPRSLIVLPKLKELRVTNPERRTLLVPPFNENDSMFA